MMEASTTQTPDLSDHHEVYGYLRGLMQRGDSTAVIRTAGVIAASATEPVIAVQAMAFQLGAMTNTGDLTGFAAVADQAFEALPKVDEPTVAAELHTLSSEFAASQGAMERCLRHLLLSRRSLLTAAPWLGAADAWYDLGLQHSKLGLHDDALWALDRAIKLYESLGHHDEILGSEIRVRHALAMDHRGETTEAVRLLTEVVTDYHGVRDRGTAPVWSMDRAYIAYAAARLAALGHARHRVVVGIVDDTGCDVPEQATRQCTPVCLALADGDVDRALETLTHSPVAAKAFGAAETHRLACLAHTMSGRVEPALAEQRLVTSAVVTESDRLMGQLLDCVAARIDQEQLRELAARHAAAAYTDALTGLPNRRRLTEYASALAATGREAMLGVVDLNDFKALNDMYGHLAGDLVLQRVAAILSRTVRRDDFVARYGGDEFVVILSDVDIDAAGRLGQRVRQQLASHNWSGLVVGTVPDVAIGWAALSGRGLDQAFRVADRAMYAMKRRMAADTLEPVERLRPLREGS